MTEIKLIKQAVEYDEFRQEVTTETERTILAHLKEIGRSEFYQAAASDLVPEIAFDIHSFEYDYERIAEVDGQRYSIFRTYRHFSDGLEMIELTCGKKVGV